jgi:hypothetical protein
MPAHEPGTSTGALEQPGALEDDMIDTPADFKHWPFLHHTLEGCRDSLVRTYLNSNRAAAIAQRIHREWVARAAFLATLAVCLAILQLAGLRHRFMTILEGIAVVTAAWAFANGQKSRHEWLTERHKAERCRLLKFGALIRPGLWDLHGLQPAESAPELGDQMDALQRISLREVKKWLSDDSLPPPPSRLFPRSLDQLTELRDYYREKRLQFQTKYFRDQSELDVKRDEWWRSVPRRLFTASVIIVGLHVVIEAILYLAGRMGMAGPGPQSLRWVEVLLGAVIACAALLPVLGSGIRTWRSAHEATRNISRFRAKRVALENIESRLEKGKLQTATEAERVLRDLWCAEQIMESEHREWLRLMMEAEWLG